MICNYSLCSHQSIQVQKNNRVQQRSPWCHAREFLWRHVFSVIPRQGPSPCLRSTRVPGLGFWGLTRWSPMSPTHADPDAVRVPEPHELAILLSVQRAAVVLQPFLCMLGAHGPDALTPVSFAPIIPTAFEVTFAAESVSVSVSISVPPGWVLSLALALSPASQVAIVRTVALVPVLDDRAAHASGVMGAHLPADVLRVLGIAANDSRLVQRVVAEISVALLPPLEARSASPAAHPYPMIPSSSSSPALSIVSFLL